MFRGLFSMGGVIFQVGPESHKGLSQNLPTSLRFQKLQHMGW